MKRKIISLPSDLISSRAYLLDIVLALVPYLDEKRLELLEGKLKQLFSLVMKDKDRNGED